MTIDTRNEVLVTCQDTPLMELLRHLVAEHPEDMDYCLDTLGWHGNPEPQEEAQTVRTRQEFFDLPLGTVVKIPHVGTYCKTAINAWTKPSDFPYASPIHSNNDMWSFTISVNAPAAVVFTPEVQA